MRPKTSVRQPVIAGAGRQQLSEMLRRWRRQPRKRSPLLFWTLLSLGLISDSALLLLGARILGVSQSSPPLERRMHVPYATDSALWEPLRHWVVRIDGRTRLFESFCGEAVRRISGEERFEGRDPVAVAASWMLDAEDNSLKWDDYPFLRCDDAELRALLYREADNPSRMTRQEQLQGRFVEPAAVSSSGRLRDILRRVGTRLANRLSPLERHAVELQKRLALFQQIRGGCVDGGDSAEMHSAKEALQEAYESGDSDLFAAALSDFVDASRRTLGVEDDPAECRRLAWESWLYEYAPPRQALYLSLLAVGLLTAAVAVRMHWPRWRRRFLAAGLLACLGSLSWATVGVIGQSIRDGAAPVGDGGQAVLWLAGTVLFLSVCLALLCRESFLALTGALASSAGFLAASRWPLALAESWPTLPEGNVNDICMRMQMLILVSAYAALALCGAMAALTLVRVLLASPSGERLRRLSALCVRTICMGIVLLAASALLDGWRALEQGIYWRGWNVQTVGTIVVLPGCAALVYARRRGWIQPFGLMVGLVIGWTLLAMTWHSALRGEIVSLQGSNAVAADAVLYLAGLSCISLAAHAALRYYFGRQRILQA